MERITLYVPMLYAARDGGKSKAFLAIHKTEGEVPMTEATPYALVIAGEPFLFKPLRMLRSFEDRESAVVLAFTSSGRRSKKMMADISERFFKAVRKDPRWDVYAMPAEHVPFFIRTIAVPVSLRPPDS